MGSRVTLALAALEAHGAGAGDQQLLWMVRHERLVHEVAVLRRAHKKGNVEDYQADLIVKGTMQQLAEWSAAIPPEVSSSRMSLHHQLPPDASHS